MNCPVCKTSALVGTEIEAGLHSQRCAKCSGIWLASADYWKWLESFPARQKSTTSASASSIQVEDNRGAKICPNCSHILWRYRVGLNIPFGLDHCGVCNGVWFDAREYDALKAAGLHLELPQIFSPEWQQRLREEERARKLTALYREQFGPEVYAELERVKKWLDSQPQRGAMLGFLNQ